jgi:hypothetical protein
MQGDAAKNAAVAHAKKARIRLLRLYVSGKKEWERFLVIAW